MDVKNIERVKELGHQYAKCEKAIEKLNGLLASYDGSGDGNDLQLALKVIARTTCIGDSLKYVIVRSTLDTIVGVKKGIEDELSGL